MRYFLALLLACVFALPTISQAKVLGSRSPFNGSKYSTMAVLSGYMGCVGDLIKNNKMDPTFSQLSCECVTDAAREGRKTDKAAVLCANYAEIVELGAPVNNMFSSKKWPTHSLFMYAVAIYDLKKQTTTPAKAWQYSTCKTDLLREYVSHSKFLELGESGKLASFFQNFDRNKKLSRCNRFLR